MRRLSRLLAIAVFAVAGSAWGQTITGSFSGSGSGNGIAGFSGSGTGTLTPGGAATSSFTGLSSHNDNCTNVIQFIFTVTDSAGSLSLLFTGPNQESSTFSITGPLTVVGGTGSYAGKGGSGTQTINVNLTLSSSGNGVFTFTTTSSVTLSGSLVTAAIVNPSGIVPVYTDVASIEPGSWVSIYGSNLANSTVLWNGDFPTSLGNVTVSIDGKLAYLWFVSAGQINLQVPADANTGCVPVVVSTPNGQVTTSVQLASISPSFSMLDSQYVAAIILTPNGTGAYGGGTYDIAGPVGHFSYATRPAKPGESVVLYGVGFGPTSPNVAPGQVFSGAAQTVNQVVIILGGMQAPVAFSGLVGAGLYQINITIPSNAPSGDLNLQGSVVTSSGNVSTSGDYSVLLSVQ